MLGTGDGVADSSTQGIVSLSICIVLGPPIGEATTFGVGDVVEGVGG